jgi:hypothetical protein
MKTCLSFVGFILSLVTISHGWTSVPVTLTGTKEGALTATTPTPTPTTLWKKSSVIEEEEDDSVIIISSHRRRSIVHQILLASSTLIATTTQAASFASAAAAAAAAAATTTTAATTTAPLILELEDSLEKLKPVPSLLQAEEWDKVRTILKSPPIVQLWNLGDGKNTISQLAKLTDDFELIDFKDEISLSLQMCDQYTYNNVFVYFQPGTLKSRSRTIVLFVCTVCVFGFWFLSRVFSMIVGGVVWTILL